MRRFIAITFVVTLLLTSYIIPITSVFATEVTWSDNNTYYLTQTEYNNVRKLAVLDIIPQLTSSGVNQLSIENANDVDDWVDNFLDYIDNYIPDPESTTDILSTIIEIRNGLDEATNRIGQELKSIGLSIPIQTVSLSDWLID